MNNIPFTTIDFTLIIGLGLISSFYIGFILFYSTLDLTMVEKISFSFLPIVLLNFLNTFTISIIIMIFIGLIFVMGVFKDIESEKTEVSKEKTKKLYDYTFLIPLPFLLLGFHWTYSLLYILTFMYIFLFSKSIKVKKSLMFFGTFILIISMSYSIALFINYNGLKVANIGKVKIMLNYKGKDYNSVMVYENSDYIFLFDDNKSISIPKQNIDSKIQYFEYFTDNPIEDNIKLIRNFINE